MYLVSLAAYAPQASAATLTGMPGGHISDPIVRQVDIARPAVVRIITKLNGQLAVRFTPTSQAVTFPQGGGSYPIELSGSGAFISAHGDILTADHVVNPPHDQSMNDALYQTAAQDVADYVNAHFQTNQPFAAADALAELETGAFPSTPTYTQPTSEVYLSAAYVGSIDATKFSNIPANDKAAVDHIEAQSSVDAMDVAIVHVSGMDDMPSIQLGDSSQVAEQDNLTIIGYPGLADLSQSPTNLLTSSINKIYVSAIKTTDSGAPVIQVGGNVEHGDSGGPALDANGNVVGVVSFGLVDPNGSGQTSFLQASNSARTLIQSLNLNTRPGAFESAWSQAIKDYGSLTPGHWHTATRELQNLAATYKGFLGVTPYLTYAQDQQLSEQMPGTSTGPNPILIVLLTVLALIILAVVLFFLLKRRKQPALAGYGVTQFPTGAYSQQPGGVSAGAYSSGIYPQQPGGIAGAYPSGAYPQQPGNGEADRAAPASYSSPNYAPLAPGAMPVSYPPTPASYGDATWQEQPASRQVPQTPQPVVSQTPLPLSSTQDASEARSAMSLPPGVQTPRPVESNGATSFTRQEHAYEHSLPTWTPPGPSSESAAYAQPVAHSPEPAAYEQSDQPVLISGSLSEIGEKSAVYSLSTQQDETKNGDLSAMALPANADWPPIAAQDEGNKTVLAPPSAAPRSFAVPRRPSTPLATNPEMAVVSSSSGIHTWIAPCGHTNTPEVRFCRVCGQPTTAANAQDGADVSN